MERGPARPIRLAPALSFRVFRVFRGYLRGRTGATKRAKHTKAVFTSRSKLSRLSNGKLVILSGPSGVGKDTVIDAWRARNPRVARVVAYTTRPPRSHEIDGIDYHFVPVKEFMRMAEAGDFLEYKEVHGNYYATPKTDMEAMLRDGCVAVLKIDVQGAMSVMPIRPDALSVFLLPPNREELRRRIEGRGTDDPETVERRMRNAEEEIALSDNYRFPIVNRDITSVIDELEAIIDG